MKKLLIATAALAMVAGTAQAQSSVTVYGIIDTGYNSLENTNSAGTKVERSRIIAGDAGAGGEAATSRLGFRGSEDLGGGLKANFIIETGIGASTTVVGDRAFWAGLEDAKLGELRIGRQDTFGRTVWLANDQLAAANVVGNLAHSNAGTTIDGTPAPFAAASAADSSNTSVGSHTARLISANYLSPRKNGVQLSVGVMQDNTEQTGTAKVETGNGSQVGLNYVAGKLTAGIAYLEAKTTANTSAGVLNSSLKTKETVGAASYNLGFARVAYIYNKRDINQGVPTNGTVGPVTGQAERESHSFSASVPMGAKLVGRVGYGFGEYKGGASNSYNGDLKGMQAALNYNLSKRTMAYAIYGDESREISATTKAKAKEYSVGVRHSF